MGEKTAHESRKPMVWTGGAYGGQVAVRIGDMKAMRRQLFKGAKGGPLDWEVYDLAKDLEEKNDLSAAYPEVVEAAKTVLKKEYRHSEAFRDLFLYDSDPATALKH
jgi:hypothetical protein